jgi:isocitrate dehydrogenase kinase/phosphatase
VRFCIRYPERFVDAESAESNAADGISAAEPQADERSVRVA